MSAENEHPIIDPYASQRASVRRGIAQFQERLQAAGHDFRDPPPEPTSCCGRGCNGCVWESYDAALLFWYEDAGALMAVHRTTHPFGSSTSPDPARPSATDA